MNKRIFIHSIVFLLIIFYPSMSVSLGWKEVSKNNLNEYSISIEMGVDVRRNCYRIKANFSDQLTFGDLGGRKLSSIYLLKIDSKERGWQLMSKGSQVKLAVNNNENRHGVDELCLSEADLMSSYLSVSYIGLESMPPMVLLIDLSEFR